MSYKVTRLGPPRIRRDTIIVGDVVFEAADLAPLTVEDEGTPLATAASTLDFVGAGVTASGTGASKTITIPGGSGLTVEDEGTPLTTDATTLDFVGSGVTASGAGATKTITIPGGSGLTVEDEGTPLTTAADTLDFVGSGVTASGTGTTKTITIPGGSGITVEDEGSPLTTSADTLDFVGAGVTATGSGTTKTITIPGGGGSVLYPLDDVTLDGTYGDHFDAATLDAKWTRRTLPDPAEVIADSWLQITPFESGQFGYLQSWTPTTEAEFQMAASAFMQSDDGFGIAILDSSGTGLWLGWRDTIQGLFSVTTYTVSGSAASAFNFTNLVSRGYLGSGQKVWLSLIKKSGLYWFRFSFDGATWTRTFNGFVPSSFTPSQIGIYSGLVGGTPNLRSLSVDWFNVIDEMSIGNNLMITPTSGTVTASAAGTAFTGSPADVIDGNTGSASWIVTNATPVWWNAAFSSAQTMNRLRFYGYDHDWGNGYVEFSSGTKIPFYNNAGDMKNIYLDFPDETTTFVKVWAHMVGNGSFLGWREIEAYLAS